ncbi:Ig-like domain-containing protein [Sediminibacterium goheungense]|uniref:Ig-like domain-containing protein n=1 Tax=Sediminibacterium goheungense TaxID=1086393 RepID=A0A4R6IUW6_9BACT|nr:Ig-like domain-containing protein [Sediminibacterium goheungense]TDO26419.1 Ig-like domain-containing protein [Sediminibacterium goheungense]
MKRKLSTSSFVQLLILLVSVVMFAGSCANIVPPSGGDRDSLPPRLVMALPKDSAVNVKTKNITLSFDEFVELDNTSENIIYSPVLKSTPAADYKLRNVTIKFRDSLEPNTTYSIDFGSAIKDVNEENIARNFRYVFSTGPTIDFNTYAGKVIVAETGKIDSTLWVVLHRDLSDSAIQKLQPRFYTRLNGKGEFSFKNLPAGTFAAYVVNKNSYNKVFDSTELFAFRNGPVTINGNTSGDTLYAFIESPKPAKTATDAGAALPPSLKDDRRLRYLPVFDNGQQDLMSDLPLYFNRKLFAVDTTKIALLDSNFKAIQGYKVNLDSTRKKLIIDYPWKENMVYKLIMQKEALADTNAVTLPKSDTVTILSRKETEYGTVRFRLPNIDTSLHPIIQLVKNEEITASYPVTVNDFTIKRFKPGTYDVRILYDTNKNGKWDTGHFSAGKKQQPERVISIPRTLNIRANWDNEVTIALQ